VAWLVQVTYLYSRMIKLLDLLKEAQGKPKAIFMAGPAGSGKTFVSAQLIPKNLTVINVDDTYEELLKAAGLGMKIADFNQDQLSQAAKLMGQAQKATKEKYAELSGAKKDIIIDGTGAASKPLLKKKAELEELGYDTMMVMIWVSPYTSLERNANRDRALAPSIVVKTWAGVNGNIDNYKQAFGDKFVLINNDPNGKLEYDPAVARERFFKTVKGSGKIYTPDEKAKRDKEIADLNANIEQLVRSTPEFTSMDDAKSKINSFLK
jgi:cytidylate kinase